MLLPLREVRLDATIMFSDECEIDYENTETDDALRGCSVMTYAHEHEVGAGPRGPRGPRGPEP